MQSPVTPDDFDAVLFDLDGVLTTTATLHEAAWRSTFDVFLRPRDDRPSTETVWGTQQLTGHLGCVWVFLRAPFDGGREQLNDNKASST